MSSLVALFPYIVAIAISLAITIYTLRYRSVPGALHYAWVSLGQATVVALFMIEWIVVDLEVKIAFDNLQWLAIFVTTIMLWIFVRRFADHSLRDDWYIIILLSVFPLVYMLLLITNPFHELLYSAPIINEEVPFTELTYDNHLLYYSALLYVLGVSLVSLLMLAWDSAHKHELYRTQSNTIIIGASLPLLAGILEGLHLIPDLGLSLYPLSFAASSAIVLWGLYYQRLFEVAPIARDMVVETMHDALIVVDVQKRIVDVNHAAETLIQQSNPQRQIIGADFNTVLGARASIDLTYSRISDPFEIMLTVAGTIRYFSVSMTPITIREKTIGGMSVLLRDISDLKHVEFQLRDQAQELELAKYYAEQADHLKSNFLANVSHELRTPLNAVINFNQFVSTGLFGEVNEKQVDALDKSTGSARHLLALINDVLDLSKIEAGRMDVHLEENVDLERDLQEIAATIEALIGDKPLKLNFCYPQPMPPLNVDRKHIRQILLNLLSNAVKFTAQGEITLEVRAEADEMLFAVTDTGQGIPQEEQQTIFDPFRQSSRNHREAGGTGLGLAISKRLVEAHNGRMWLESQVDVGSRFQFVIPMRGVLVDG